MGTIIRSLLFQNNFLHVALLLILFFALPPLKFVGEKNSRICCDLLGKPEHKAKKKNISLSILLIFHRSSITVLTFICPTELLWSTTSYIDMLFLSIYLKSFPRISTDMFFTLFHTTTIWRSFVISIECDSWVGSSFSQRHTPPLWLFPSFYNFLHNSSCLELLCPFHTMFLTFQL